MELRQLCFTTSSSRPYFFSNKQRGVRLINLLARISSKIEVGRRIIAVRITLKV